MPSGGRGVGRGRSKGPTFTSLSFPVCDAGLAASKDLALAYVAPSSHPEKNNFHDDAELVAASSKRNPGSNGERLAVLTNLFQMSLNEAPRILYRVDIVPEVDEQRKRRFLVHKSLDEENDLVCLFDGDHLLYTSRLLHKDKKTVLPRTVRLTTPTVEYAIRFKFAGEQNAQINKSSVNFFNTILRTALAKQTERIRIGHQFFNFKQAIEIRERLCRLVPGIASTLLVTQSGPLMNADIIFKHVRTDTVYDVMFHLGLAAQERIQKEMSHKVVLLSYGQQRCVIVDRVRFDLSPQSTFLNRKTNQTITYSQYFRQKYNIADPRMNRPQPLLESVSRSERNHDGTPKVTHYIPCLCFLTGQTEEMKNDKTRQRDLIQRTALPPAQRMDAIHNNLSAVLNDPVVKQELDRWRLSVDVRPLKVPARRLPQPNLVNGSGRIQVDDFEENWDVKYHWPMLEASNFENWVLVTFAQTQTLKNFVENLMPQVARELSIPFKLPTILTASKEGADEYMSILKSEVPKMKPLPTFAMLVVGHRDVPYIKCKEYLTVKVGVPSQFVNIKTLDKAPLVKANKLLMQMNVKAGGAPWKVELGLAHPTMFIGLAIHHGGDLEHQNGSVAGFVATRDLHCTKYYSRIFTVKAKQQIMVPLVPGAAGLKQLTVDALHQFRQTNNGTAPKHLIIFREGGSEGDLAMIQKHEVPRFKEALDELKLEATVTFIVVLKGIRVRMYTHQGHNNSVANPAPGTVVDTHIVSHALPEFYLVCQHVDQGSATPTKYQVVHDSANFSMDVLQMATYGLSHAYYNWNGTVREPSVVKYASTLALFSGQYLGGVEASKLLHGRLYYI